MSLVNCPECGSQISDEEQKCPKCGWIITSEQDTNIDRHSSDETLSSPTECHDGEGDFNNQIGENAQDQKAEQESKPVNNKKKVIIASSVCIVAAVIALIVTMPYIRSNIENKNSYDEAVSLYEEGDYNKALTIFSDLEGYKDSDSMYYACYYGLGEESFLSGDYKDAVTYFEKAGDYNDSEERYDESLYYVGQSYENNLNYGDAYDYYSESDYSDSVERAAYCKQMTENRWFDGEFHFGVNEFATIFEYNLQKYYSSATVEVFGEDSNSAGIEINDGYGNSFDILLEDVVNDQTIGEMTILATSLSTNYEMKLWATCLRLMVQITNTNVDSDTATEILKECFDYGINYAYNDGITYENIVAPNGWALSIYSND